MKRYPACASRLAVPFLLAALSFAGPPVRKAHPPQTSAAVQAPSSATSRIFMDGLLAVIISRQTSSLGARRKCSLRRSSFFTHEQQVNAHSFPVPQHFEPLAKSFASLHPGNMCSP